MQFKKYTELLTIRISREMKEKFMKKAEKNRDNPSELIRNYIEKYLKGE